MKAKELTEWREAAGLSQGELAKKLGVHVITVNRWENEAREIPTFLPLALETVAVELKQESARKKPSPKK